MRRVVIVSAVAFAVTLTACSGTDSGAMTTEEYMNDPLANSSESVCSKALREEFFDGVSISSEDATWDTTPPFIWRTSTGYRIESSIDWHPDGVEPKFVEFDCTVEVRTGNKIQTRIIEFEGREIGR